MATLMSQDIESERNIGALRVAGVTEECHFLIHGATHRATPAEIRFAGKKGDGNECKYAEEETEKKPRFNFPSLAMCNESAQNPRR